MRRCCCWFAVMTAVAAARGLVRRSTAEQRSRHCGYLAIAVAHQRVILPGAFPLPPAPVRSTGTRVRVAEKVVQAVLHGEPVPRIRHSKVQGGASNTMKKKWREGERGGIAWRASDFVVRQCLTL